MSITASILQYIVQTAHMLDYYTKSMGDLYAAFHHSDALLLTVLLGLIPVIFWPSMMLGYHLTEKIKRFRRQDTPITLPGWFSCMLTPAVIFVLIPDSWVAFIALHARAVAFLLILDLCIVIFTVEYTLFSFLEYLSFKKSNTPQQTLRAVLSVPFMLFAVPYIGFAFTAGYVIVFGILSGGSPLLARELFVRFHLGGFLLLLPLYFINKAQRIFMLQILLLNLYFIPLPKLRARIFGRGASGGAGAFVKW
jgi:hypothetical protein